MKFTQKYFMCECVCKWKINGAEIGATIWLEVLTQLIWHSVSVNAPCHHMWNKKWIKTFCVTHNIHIMQKIEFEIKREKRVPPIWFKINTQKYDEVSVSILWQIFQTHFIFASVVNRWKFSESILLCRESRSSDKLHSIFTTFWASRMKHIFMLMINL